MYEIPHIVPDVSDEPTYQEWLGYARNFALLHHTTVYLYDLGSYGLAYSESTSYAEFYPILATIDATGHISETNEER